MLSDGVMVCSEVGMNETLSGGKSAVSVFVLLNPENIAEMAPSCPFPLTSCAKMSSHAKEISNN